MEHRRAAMDRSAVIFVGFFFSNQPEQQGNLLLNSQQVSDSQLRNEKNWSWVRIYVWTMFLCYCTGWSEEGNFETDVSHLTLSQVPGLNWDFQNHYFEALSPKVLIFKVPLKVAKADVQI